MSATSKEISDVLMSKLFRSPDLLAFTSNVYDHNMLGSLDTTGELTKILSSGLINFVQYSVQRRRKYERLGMGDCLDYEYKIEIEYFVEATCNTNENIIQQFFETLDDILSLKVGDRIDNLVNGYAGSQNYPQVQFRSPIELRPIVSGRYTYTAYSNN